MGRRREDVLNDLNEALVLADVGVSTTEKIIAGIEQKTKRSDPFEAVEAALKCELVGILSKYPGRIGLDSAPGVMMIGVNGGGKTTSLAKLARRFANERKKCLLVAADTFRAAAQEQLAV